MPSKYSSPYATSFKNAVNRGTPWQTAVESIAKRTNKTTTSVWNSLWKAGHVKRMKFNGQWLYWPTFAKKTNATNWKNQQFQMWQWFMNWSVSNGYANPENFTKYCSSQKEFMNYFRKFFAKQFATPTPKRMAPKRTPKDKRRTTKNRTYKFPKAKSRTTRRYRRAA